MKATSPLTLSPIVHALHRHAGSFHPVVSFNADKDRLLAMDLSENNSTLTPEIYNNTAVFSAYIDQLLIKQRCRYGAGGYNEQRPMYAASHHFDATTGEPRRLHLGLDIWGPAGTPVYAFMGGSVHSFAYNDHYGDYGATLVLLHQLEGMAFYSLYGHISLEDIAGLREGMYMVRGQQIARFGTPDENGHWPPHLHFQLIIDMELKRGDYPGVCRYSDRPYYLHNCPDPDIVAQLMQYAVADAGLNK